jgi:hypothetical protein
MIVPADVSGRVGMPDIISNLLLSNVCFCLQYAWWLRYGFIFFYYQVEYLTLIWTDKMVVYRRSRMGMMLYWRGEVVAGEGHQQAERTCIALFQIG